MLDQFITRTNLGRFLSVAGDGGIVVGECLILLVSAEHKQIQTDEGDERGHAPDEDSQRRRHDRGHAVRERAAERGGERPHGGLHAAPLRCGRVRREPLGAPEAREERGEEGGRGGDEGQVPRVVTHAPRRGREAVAHGGHGGGAEAVAAHAPELRGEGRGHCWVVGG